MTTATTAPNAASTSDLLAALQNVVQALNLQVTTGVQLAGQQNFTNLTAATVVKASAGRIVRVSVIVAGSAAGKIYDGASLTATSKPIYVIPNTVGVVDVNIPTAYGLLVVPGTGMTVSGSFS